jgi:hypothetical protein
MIRLDIYVSPVGGRDLSSLLKQRCSIEFLIHDNDYLYKQMKRSGSEGILRFTCFETLVLPSYITSISSRPCQNVNISVLILLCRPRSKRRRKKTLFYLSEMLWSQRKMILGSQNMLQKQRTTLKMRMKRILTIGCACKS